MRPNDSIMTGSKRLTSRSERRLLCVAVLIALHLGRHGVAQPNFAPGFGQQLIAADLGHPVGIAFALDGRMFVADQAGAVRVIQFGEMLAQPFIDLGDEVNGQWDRGLLGIALDPDFMTNRYVYLLYVVDPKFGEPDENPQVGTFARLVRYTATIESDGNIADPDSRLVLIGEQPVDGFPICDRSHAIGSVRIAANGTLFVSAGDGAHFETTDDGGLDPECFGDGMFGEDENIGAFRSQYLGSLAGKVLRIDAATGLGLPSNPHWTGNGRDKQSKVWVNGLRNPYRFAVKPDSGSPATIFICDVGWNRYEETNVAHGGENFGWPCFEGRLPAPNYPNADPAHSGCDTIQTPSNPGPLTEPVITWHHSNPNLSFPPGYVGRAATAGAFYTGPFYPPPFDHGFFVADYSSGSWLKVLQVNKGDEFVALHDFAGAITGVIDLAAHPLNGDLYYVSRFTSSIHRIRYVDGVLGDIDGDGVVGVVDLLLLLGAWGACDACPADIDGDFSVGVPDLLALLGNWG